MVAGHTTRMMQSMRNERSPSLLSGKSISNFVRNFPKKSRKKTSFEASMTRFSKAKSSVYKSTVWYVVALLFCQGFVWRIAGQQLRLTR
ncbi:unnamed protein product [Oikopleura dioica]|uniref:Uncharacterized protein n=1 Tax=Oikopleura dioica TaxID=34765 RepID=E4XBW1_OIKDI|nr:unnamed protein product [Oikopleura dioica]